MTGKNALDSIIVLQVHEMVLNPVQTIMNSETMIPHITRSVKRFCCIYRRVKHRNCRQPIAVIQRQISAHKLCKLTDGKPGTKWPVNELQCQASLWPIQKFSFFFFFGVVTYLLVYDSLFSHLQMCLRKSAIID